MSFFLGISDQDWFAIVISITALFLTLTKDFFLPWFIYPRIECEIGTKGQFIANDEVNNVNHKWYRLKIENKDKRGTELARNMYVKLYKIERNGEELQPFNPMKLRFVSSQESGNLVLEESLARGEFDYVNLCTLVDQRNIKQDVLLYPDAKFEGYAAGSLAPKFFLPGTFIYKLAVHAENLKKSKSLEIRITFQLDNGEPDVSIEKITDCDQRQ